MTRVLSGAVLVGIVGAAVIWAPSWVLLGMAAVVAVLAMREFAALADRAGAPVPAAVSGIAALALCVAAALAGSSSALVVAAVVLVQSVMAVGASRPAAGTLPAVAAAVFGPLYVGLPLGWLVAVHAAWGAAATLLLIGVVALSDTAQYYGGRFAGRRPLAPVISPKKTIEGAVAGVVAAPIALVAAGTRLWPEASPVLLIALGVAIALLGIAGDLFESLMKRSVGVKDSSALIPGHGGVLDRIDALLFAAPVYYAVLPYAIRPA